MILSSFGLGPNLKSPHAVLSPRPTHPEHAASVARFFKLVDLTGLTTGLFSLSGSKGWSCEGEESGSKSRRHVGAATPHLHYVHRQRTRGWLIDPPGRCTLFRWCWSLLSLHHPHPPPLLPHLHSLDAEPALVLGPSMLHLLVTQHHEGPGKQNYSAPRPLNVILRKVCPGFVVKNP